jgi:hypothetical protein
LYALTVNSEMIKKTTDTNNNIASSVSIDNSSIGRHRVSFQSHCSEDNNDELSQAQESVNESIDIMSEIENLKSAITRLSQDVDEIRSLVSKSSSNAVVNGVVYDQMSCAKPNRKDDMVESGISGVHIKSTPKIGPKGNTSNHPTANHLAASHPSTNTAIDNTLEHMTNSMSVSELSLAMQSFMQVVDKCQIASEQVGRYVMYY